MGYLLHKHIPIVNALDTIFGSSGGTLGLCHFSGPRGREGALCEVLTATIGQQVSTLQCFNCPIENALGLVKFGGIGGKLDEIIVQYILRSRFSGSCDVIFHVTIQFAIGHFLLVVRWNRTSISSRFWNNGNQTYWGRDLDLSWSCDVNNHVTIRFAIVHVVLVVLWNGASISVSFRDIRPTHRALRHNAESSLRTRVSQKKTSKIIFITRATLC